MTPIMSITAGSMRHTMKPSLSYERLTLRRLVLVLLVSLALLAAFAVLAVAVGSEHIEIRTIAKIIGAAITGDSVDATPEQIMIITQIRLPRIGMAVVVGAAFAVAGSAYQALLRNPLADPGILGISTGAALGAIAATIFAESIPTGRPIAAFTGAAVTTAAVYFLGQKRRGASSERLVLAGMIINAFLSSVVIYLLTAASGSRLRSAFSWLIGDLGGDPLLLPLVAVFVAIGVSIIYVSARSLNLLMMGDQEAQALGVETGRVQIVVYLAASLITGAAVAACGVIGFVGLIVPHAVRLAGGSDNRLVVPGSAVIGAAFLVMADMIARTVISPREVHIGVITAFIGAPIFVYLLRRTT
jgi:cobalamin transport system permease protein